MFFQVITKEYNTWISITEVSQKGFKSSEEYPYTALFRAFYGECRRSYV